MQWIEITLAYILFKPHDHNWLYVFVDIVGSVEIGQGSEAFTHGTMPSNRRAVKTFEELFHAHILPHRWAFSGHG